MEVGPLVVLVYVGGAQRAAKGRSKPPGRSGRLPRTATGTHAAWRDAPRHASTIADGQSTLRRHPARGYAARAAVARAGRTLDEVGTRASPTVRTLPPAKAGTPSRSLEAAPKAKAGDRPARGERAVVDQDDEAERVVERRRAAADANLKPRSEGITECSTNAFARSPRPDGDARVHRQAAARGGRVARDPGPPVSLRGDQTGNGRAAFHPERSEDFQPIRDSRRRSSLRSG